jgi:hypothetical protein
MGGPNGLAHIAINGDAGADALAGSVGQETINGGLDNDTIEGRGGSDLIDGGAGNDVLKWQFTGGGQIDRTSFTGGLGTDTLQLESVANFRVAWSFGTPLADGVAALHVGNGGISLDFAGIENVEILGGAAGSNGDRFLIADNRSVNSFDITLRNPADDFVSFGSGGNIVGTSSIAAGVSITGFSSSVRVHGAQAKDVIEVQGSGSGEVIDMSGLRFVPFGLTVHGDFGNDTIIGPKGTVLSLVKPQLLGDHGDDTIVGGTGGELIDGGQGSDTLFSSGLGTTFKFRWGDLGVDTVHNFRAHSFGGPADLMHMRDVFFGHETFESAKQKGLIEDTGSDVVISVDGHTVAVLSNINLDQLSSADFFM